MIVIDIVWPHPDGDVDHVTDCENKEDAELILSALKEKFGGKIYRAYDDVDGANAFLQATSKRPKQGLDEMLKSIAEILK